MRLFNEYKSVFDTKCNDIAIVDKNGTRLTSYHELYNLSLNVAHKLLALGICPGDKIIIQMDRSMEYISAELGVLFIGAVFIPLSIECNQKKFKQIESDSLSKFCIRKSFYEDVNDFDSSLLLNVYSDTDLAMIIYTSGSTDQPKGVVYNRSELLALSVRFMHLLPNTSFLNYASITPNSFIANVGEIFGNLLADVCIHILPDECRTNVKDIENYYSMHNIGCGFLPPSLLSLYHNKDNSLLRVLTGSERVRKLYSSEYEILNVYAQTEAMFMSSFLIDHPYDECPIGTSPDGVRLMLLDEHGMETFDGVGEICANGVFPHSYLNLDNASEHTFHCEADGTTTVHTGDMGRYLSDGNLLCLGRFDEVIKINGQKVNLVSITQLIDKHFVIDQIAAKVFTSIAGEPFIVVFYSSEVAIEPNLFINVLKENLPSYMIPRKFIRLSKLPTNLNGKIDLQKLTLPSCVFNILDNQSCAPIGVDEEVDTLIKKIFGCDNIPGDEDLSNYGLSSLWKIMLIVQLEETFKVKIDMSQYNKIVTINLIKKDLHTLLSM